jgi:Nif-specific regulatory protein
MAADSEGAMLERLRRERDLYAGLLNLAQDDDPAPFLRRALDLIVGILGADQGYLELFDPDRSEGSFSHATGFSEGELSEVKESVSRGIISEAIASERVVVTPSALLDPRFRDRVSVMRSKIDAVLCAPIGRDPPSGVLYLQSGAVDFFGPDNVAQVELFARQLAPLLQSLLRRRRHARADPCETLRQKLRADDFVGKSKALAQLLREVELVAPLDVGVLIHGQTGTGKTQVARLIHRNSTRARGAIIELNCGAIQDSLFESELFGARRGAHSTADRDIQGKVAAAEGGTLFLDEVADLSPASQAKLLQFLQTHEYYPLGAPRPERADVRVIAATNVDLAQAVSEKKFRSDLLYRLQIVGLRAPSLGERAGDVALLATHFCEQARTKHGLPYVEFSPGALRAIETAEWPGNIRELENKVVAATIRAGARHLRHIEQADLFPALEGKPDPAAALTFQEETRRFQKQLLRRTLEATDWTIAAAARRLDLTRTHVYTLIKSFGLTRDD